MVGCRTDYSQRFRRMYYDRPLQTSTYLTKTSEIYDLDINEFVNLNIELENRQQAIRTCEDVNHNTPCNLSYYPYSSFNKAIDENPTISRVGVGYWKNCWECNTPTKNLTLNVLPKDPLMAHVAKSLNSLLRVEFFTQAYKFMVHTYQHAFYVEDQITWKDLKYTKNINLFMILTLSLTAYKKEINECYHPVINAMKKDLREWVLNEDKNYSNN